MKIIQLTILIIAIFSVCKYAQSNGSELSFDVSFFDYETLPDPENYRKDRLYGFGVYDPHTKTAEIAFNRILERNQAVTPAWVINPAYVQIGTIPTPNYIENTQRLAGGRSKTTRLYGIVKDPSKNYPGSTFRINFNKIIEHQRHSKMQGRYFPEKKQATILFTHVLETTTLARLPEDPRYVLFGSYSGDAAGSKMAQSFYLFGIPE